MRTGCGPFHAARVPLLRAGGRGPSASQCAATPRNAPDPSDAPDAFDACDALDAPAASPRSVCDAVRASPHPATTAAVATSAVVRPRLAAARRAEPAFTPQRVCQLTGLDRFGVADLDDDELGDPVPRLDLEGFGLVGVQQEHTHLAAVAGVDEAW